MSNKQISVLSIAAVIISVICLTVAYASLKTMLQISGNSVLKRASWNIELNTPNNFQNSLNGRFITGGEPKIVSNTIQFQMELLGLNEYISFDVPIENKGTIDAVLSLINISTSGIDKNKIIVTPYDDLNNVVLNNSFILNKSERKTLRITIKVDPTLTHEDLPVSSDIGVLIAFTFTQK